MGNVGIRLRGNRVGLGLVVNVVSLVMVVLVLRSKSRELAFEDLLKRPVDPIRNLVGLGVTREVIEDG